MDDKRAKGKNLDTLAIWLLTRVAEILIWISGSDASHLPVPTRRTGLAAGATHYSTPGKYA
jgi:hypothetical protein